MPVATDGYNEVETAYTSGCGKLEAAAGKSGDAPDLEGRQAEPCAATMPDASVSVADAVDGDIVAEAVEEPDESSFDFRETAGRVLEGILGLLVPEIGVSSDEQPVTLSEGVLESAILNPDGTLDLSKSKDPALRSMYEAYMKQMETYMRENGPVYSEAMGARDGRVANVEWTISYLASLGNVEMSTGCLKTSEATLGVLADSNPKLHQWEVKQVQIGPTFGGHWAVIARPRGAPLSQAMVFDAWITQSPQVFRFEDWKAKFRISNWIDAPEDGNQDPFE